MKIWEKSQVTAYSIQTSGITSWMSHFISASLDLGSGPHQHDSTAYYDILDLKQQFINIYQIHFTCLQQISVFANWYITQLAPQLINTMACQTMTSDEQPTQSVKMT